MRKSALVCLCFIASLCMAYYAGIIPSLCIAAAFAVFLLIFYIVGERNHIYVLTLCAVAVFCGCFIMGALILRQNKVAMQYNGAEEQVTACIREKISDKAALCTVYTSRGSFTAYCDFDGIFANEGDTVIGECKFTAYGRNNYKFGKGAVISAYIRVASVKEGSFVYGYREKAKKYIINVYKKYVGKSGGIACGMVLGEKEYISDDVNEMISSAGLTHLLAVSGLHVGILLAALGFLLRALRLPKYANIAVVTAVSLFYMFLTGFTPSVCRAGISAVFFAFEFFLRRRADSITVLMLLASAFCLCEPYLIANISFQLTFLATAGIILATRNIVIPMGELFENGIVKTAIVAVLGGALLSASALAMCLPAISVSFGAQSALSVVGNLLCAPFAEAFIVLCFALIPLSVIPIFAKAVGAVAALVGNGFTELGEIVSGTPLLLDVSSPVLASVYACMCFLMLLGDFVSNKHKTKITAVFIIGSALLTVISQI